MQCHLVKRLCIQAKMIHHEARGKFTQIAGPQGGTTMNADRKLRADAQAEIDKLETELTLYNDGSTGLGFVIGNNMIIKIIGEQEFTQTTETTVSDARRVLFW